MIIYIYYLKPISKISSKIKLKLFFLYIRGKSTSCDKKILILCNLYLVAKFIKNCL